MLYFYSNCEKYILGRWFYYFYCGGLKAFKFWGNFSIRKNCLDKDFNFYLPEDISTMDLLTSTDRFNYILIQHSQRCFLCQFSGAHVCRWIQVLLYYSYTNIFFFLFLPVETYTTIWSRQLCWMLLFSMHYSLPFAPVNGFFMNLF